MISMSRWNWRTEGPLAGERQHSGGLKGVPRQTSRLESTLPRYECHASTKAASFFTMRNVMF